MGTTVERIYEDLLRPLSADERKELAERLASESAPANGPRRRQWREIQGILAYPVCGEDAQEWVSRSRRESDERREQPWRRTP